MNNLKPDQLQAINHNQGDVLVSASAGSGKTFVMIERAIRLIKEEKCTVNQLLAVTFTEAAASEMKEKLKNTLIKEIDKGATYLSMQVPLIATADICTIHSFCARLIRQYFFAAEVSPDFAVADASRSDALKKESIDKTFKYFYDKGEQWFIRLCNRFRDAHRSDKSLKDIFIDLYNYFNAEASPLETASKFREVYSEQGFNNVFVLLKKFFNSEIEDYVYLLKESVSNIDESAYPKLYSLATNILNDFELALNNDIFQLKSFIAYSRPLYVERKLDSLTEQYKNNIVMCRDALKKALSSIISKIPDENQLKDIREKLLADSEEIFKVFEHFSKVYFEEKKEENCLDFDDLQHFALKVLSDSQIRKELQQKYKYVFIDEYQDVNGVQESIINAISSNNLFMVGDVKQSIYGFRGCKPEGFSIKLNKMQKEGKKTIFLNHNFRSADKILSTVNDIFSFSMTEKHFNLNYKDVSLLIGGGLYQQAPGRTQLHFLQKEKTQTEKEQPRIYDILQEIEKPCNSEQFDISSLIAHIIEEELQKTIFDVKQKKFRNLTFSDIVILSRNKKDSYIPKVVKGLAQRGIPVLSEVSQNVLDFPEVQTLVNVLKLVDCFLQDIPLISTLKSPVANISDEELAEISLFYSNNNSEKRKSFQTAFKFYLENAQTSLQQKLTTFCNYFDKIRFLSNFLSAKDLLEKIILNCGYENYLLATVDGESKQQRVSKFLSASCVNGKALSVSEFLKRIELGKDEFNLSEHSSENTVKFITMHASKGLEFPVVIICGTERKFSTQEQLKPILFDRDLGFAIKLFNDNEKTFSLSPLQLLITKKLALARMKEEMRLFYVATTRATYSMHITMEGTEDSRQDVFTKADKWCDFIPSSIPATFWTQNDFSLLNIKKRNRKVLVGKSDKFLENQIEQNLNFTYKFTEETTLPLKTNVTEVSQLNNQATYAIDNLFVEQSPNAERGTIAHKILQFYNFNSPLSVEKQATIMVEQGIISAQEKEQIDFERLQKALSHKIFNSIKNQQLFREKTFIFAQQANKIFPVDSTESVVLQGVIDLLVIEDNSAKIIDYKYSVLNKESLVKKYSKQLLLYADAVEQVLNLPVSNKIIANIFTGEVVEV